MSKLEELIAELCPEGVEYIDFGSAVTENLGGGTPSKSTSRYWNGGIPWASVKDVVRAVAYLSETIDTISQEGLNNSPSNLIPKGWLIVCTRINPGLAVIAGTDIAINQDLRAIRFRNDVDVKFMYYLFQTLKITGKGTTVKGISVNELDRIKIPIPPLPVQREIVRILDKFAELTAELTEKLTAELTARKKQYEYYRNHLLTFGDDVPTVMLGDVAEFKYGYTDTAKEHGSARFIRITDIGENGKLLHVDCKYIDLTTDSEKYLPEKGDLLMARTGATYGKTMLFDEDIAAVYASFLIRIRFIENTVLPAYYWHFAQSGLYWKQVNKLVSKAGQPQFNANVLKTVIIPVPPLSEQARIVAILDRFDALCNDLSSGIPAEIEARRKQYEYYRDKLLTFKELIS